MLLIVQNEPDVPPGLILDLARERGLPFPGLPPRSPRLGFQFHPEADREILAGWTKDTPLAEKIMADYDKRAARIEECAEILLVNFFSLARDGG